MNKTIKTLAVSGLALASSLSVSAQEAAESGFGLNAGFDLVSSYVWRGTHCAGASFQPSLGLEYKGLTFGGWGSTDFENGLNEFDLSLGYSNWGVSLLVTDYFFPSNGIGMQSNRKDNKTSGKYFEWNDDATQHQIEVSLGYDFSEVFEKVPLTVTWNTILYGNDKKSSDNGKNRYSTYIELAYQFHVKAVKLDIATGFTPWESQYQKDNHFNMVNLSLKGSYDIKITDSFSLPVFAQAVFNPNTENVYFVAGLSF